MLFAENGNGKSTIADAFICLCTDKKGSLDDKSATNKSFLKSLGTGTGETKITLNTDLGAFTTSLSGNATTFTKNPAAGQPSLNSLRRTQLINLINAPASERYSALKDYLDITNIFNGEESLRKTHREFEKDLATVVSNLDSAKTTLEKSWNDEGSPDGSMLVWAKKHSETDISKVEAEFKIVNDLMLQWQAITNKQGEINRHITSLAESEKNSNALAVALQNLQSNSSTSAPTLLSLLEQAKSYILGVPTIDKCPVCQNGILKATVIASLDVQIKSMAVLQKAAKELENAQKQHSNNVAILNKAYSEINTLILRYKNSIKGYVASVPDIGTFVNGLGTDVTENYKVYAASFNELKALYLRVETSATNKKKAIEQHTFIKRQYDSIILNKGKSKKLFNLEATAKKVLEIVENTRKDFFDNELLSVSSEVDRMYQKMHPSEGLGGIKLFLSPGFKHSLEIQANFHTAMGITPQSVYSESHLDTLAICIFIALAKKYSLGKAVLILDDVVMSVDENHLDRFIEMVHDEDSHFAHIIITTHYRPWRDRYRNNRAPGGGVHFLELRDWSTLKGISVYNGKIALDELKQMLNVATAFHRENIATSSGRILENLLDFITLKYGCRLPRKPKNDFVLSELLGGLNAALLAVFKVEQVTKDATGKYTIVGVPILLKPIIDKLKSLTAIRNQVGAHYNFDGALVRDADIIEFGNTTIEFAELLICAECGALPDRKPSGSYWETRTGSIRLYPLVQP